VANRPLIAIVGPTASGKSALALQLAQQLQGEIICADSRTVYKGMDIGTAKPSKEEQQLVPHHLLDVVAPDEALSVAKFRDLAKEAMVQCWENHRLPMLVGGSGLYVDAICYDFELRSGDHVAMDELSLSELQQKVLQKDLELNHSDFHNPRRLRRALETGSVTSGKKTLPKDWFLIGIDPGLEGIEAAIATRTQSWLREGLKDEAATLFQRYGEIELLDKTPYREMKQLLAGEIDQPEAERVINLRWRQLAKRQLTWFRRNPDITWFAKPSEAATFAQSLALKEL
jgi:tRNA dimethylallyltransferase